MALVIRQRGRYAEPDARFRAALLALVIAGVIFRVAFGVVAVRNSDQVYGDAGAFEQYAQHLSNGDGYKLISIAGNGPDARFPPVFGVVLAGVSTVGLDTPQQHRLALAVLGALAIALVGLLGRRVAGNAVGLVAAFIVAFHPSWMLPGRAVMSESIYLIVVPGVLLLALATLRAPTVRRFLVLGVAIGIAGLVRSEALLLVVFVGAPTLFVAVSDGRLRRAAVLVAGTLLVVTPWVVRNAVQLDGPSLSTNNGITLVGSYCNDMFESGPHFGSWSYDCTRREINALHRRSGPRPQVAEDRRLVGRGIELARAHAGQLPGLFAAHVGRLWGLYHSGDEVSYENDDVHAPAWVIAGQYAHWVLLPFMVLGILIARRREWLVIAGPMVMVTVNAVVFYGSTRLRAAAEPSIALFAAAGLVWLVQRIRRKGASHSCETANPLPVGSG